MNLPSATRLAEQLVEVDLFRGLSLRERVFLAQRMDFFVFRRGQVLARQAEPLESVYLIASGLVRVVQNDGRGVETELAQLGDGALVGELSLLTESLPNATVIAILDTEVWVLNRRDFQLLLQSSVRLAMAVNKAISAKLTATNQRLIPQRAGQLTGILEEEPSADPCTFALAVAQRMAYYSREAVLLIDAGQTRQNFGGVGVSLLESPDAVAHLSRLPRTYDPLSPVRILRYSDNHHIPPDASALLTAATHLRGAYRHIVFVLPTDRSALSDDILTLMDKVVVHVRRERVTQGQSLLQRDDISDLLTKGLVVVSGWPTRPRMGDSWQVQEKLAWTVAAVIHDQNPDEGMGRVARTLTKTRVGIAWGGGTARGWALAGIAKALEQLKVPMDLFAGTSAGALGAAVYGLSLDYREADARMRKILPYLERTTRLMPPFTISVHSLLRQSWWNDLIRTFLGDLTFADLLLPYAAVALDLRTGQPHIFERGPLWQAIRASSAVPVLAPPMVIAGRPYADGGVVNAVPLDVVAQMGADILIGIDLTGRENAPEWNEAAHPNMLSTLLRTINVAYNTSASRTLPMANVLIRPHLRSAMVYDMSVMDEFMKEGERATLETWPELRRAMPWLA